MRKIHYILPIVVLFISTSVFSQKRKRMSNDRVKAYKIAYITEQLNLTEKEAEKFWPIYNAHEEQLSGLRKEENSDFKKFYKEEVNIDEVSEAEAKKLVSSVSETREKMHAINKVYYTKLKNILSYKKILKLQIAEREFKRNLFERLKKKRKERKEEKEKK